MFLVDRRGGAGSRDIHEGRMSRLSEEIWHLRIARTVAETAVRTTGVFPLIFWVPYFFGEILFSEMFCLFTKKMTRDTYCSRRYGSFAENHS